MIDLSIIVPHFNSWNYLRTLIKSIPNKDSIEVIVVDDHSDNFLVESRKLKKEFPFINLISNKKNSKGAGAARNVGLDMATGQWLLFADADDVFIKKSFDIIEKYFNSEYDLIYFLPSSFKGEVGSLGDRHREYELLVNNYISRPNNVNELKLRYQFFVPWSKLIRREPLILNDIHFEEILVSNDVLFSTKVGYYSNKIQVSEIVIYSVRESSNSLTAEMDEEKFRIRFTAWIDYVKFLQNNLASDDYRALRISSLTQLNIVKKNKLGLKNVLYVINECRKNNIQIINFKSIYNKIINKNIRTYRQ